MFRIDRDVMRVLYDMGDRDLALAFAEMEGYEVVQWNQGKCKPKPVVFNEPSTTGRVKMPGSEPEQVSPGVFSYRIGMKKAQKAKTKVKSKAKSFESASASVTKEAS
jgi:hypothetical protein